MDKGRIAGRERDGKKELKCIFVYRYKFLKVSVIIMYGKHKPIKISLKKNRYNGNLT